MWEIIWVCERIWEYVKVVYLSKEKIIVSNFDYMRPCLSIKGYVEIYEKILKYPRILKVWEVMWAYGSVWNTMLVDVRVCVSK